MRGEVLKLKLFLDQKVEQYNQPSFIVADPIAIPHLFKKKQDIEIAGLFAAVFAWGNRTTILNKSKELLNLMHNDPHRFIMHHSENDLKNLVKFKHRTFNSTDLLYFIYFLKNHYSQHHSLETAFLPNGREVVVKDALNYFYAYFFSLGNAAERTKKHLAAPLNGSTCKRLNMFLRWMVRSDKIVDFGIWKRIKPSALICPVDVHVSRVARKFHLIERKQTDWLTAVELTENLKIFDAADPVKYDFALFSLGVDERFEIKKFCK